MTRSTYGRWWIVVPVLLVTVVLSGCGAQRLLPKETLGGTWQVVGGAGQYRLVPNAQDPTWGHIVRPDGMTGVYVVVFDPRDDGPVPIYLQVTNDRTSPAYPDRLAIYEVQLVGTELQLRTTPDLAPYATLKRMR